MSLASLLNEERQRLIGEVRRVDIALNALKAEEANGAAPAAPKVARKPVGSGVGTQEKVIETLRHAGGAMTAGEVATATGLGRGTVSTTLSKLATRGQIVKADRGYGLPE